jgi:hypothetical protein
MDTIDFNFIAFIPNKIVLGMSEPYADSHMALTPPTDAILCVFNLNHTSAQTQLRRENSFTAVGKILQ